jgi:hypothetical protein
LALSGTELQAIRDELASKPSVERTVLVDLADRDGVVHTLNEKVIHVHLKPARDGPGSGPARSPQ